MKVVILAGGLGTRLSEYTQKIPKPMIKINGKPILLRIMNYYSKFGFDNFYLAVGYKSKFIKNFFNNYKIKSNWKVNIIETGLNTMTGGRLKKIKNYIGNETFMMTYGDALSNVNLKKLLKFHKKKKKLCSLTIVRPPARFGYVKTKGGLVSYFKEKSCADEGWINGGFFVMEPKFFNLIKNNNTYLEREPLELVTKRRQLAAFKHRGFWQCMDTIRDKKNLEIALKKKKLKKLFD